MLVDLSTYEVYSLLKDGSTNQKQFADDLKYSEFEEFIEFLESDDEFKNFDLRDYLNGGVLKVIDSEDVDEDSEYILMSFDDKKIVLL